MRVVHQEEFFEEEKLDVAGGSETVPVLTKSELKDLPIGTYYSQKEPNEEDNKKDSTVL